MANCYLCAAKIRDGEGYRRDVVTGRSSRIYVTRHGGASYSQSQGLRTLCASCAKSLDRSRKGEGLRQTLSGLVMLFSFVITLVATSGPSTSDRSALGALVYFFFLLGGPGWLLLIVLNQMHTQDVRSQEAEDTAGQAPQGTYHPVQQSPVPTAGVPDIAPRSVQPILNVQERLSQMGVSLAGCCGLANDPDRGVKVRLFIDALVPLGPETSTVRWEQIVFEKLLRRFVNECTNLLSIILNADSDLLDQDEVVKVETAMEQLISMVPMKEEAPVAYLGRAVATLKAASALVDTFPSE